MRRNQRRRRKSILPTVLVSVLGVLCIVYLLMTLYLLNKFLPGTTINGINCFGKTVEQVEDELKQTIDGYILQVVDADGNVEELTADQLGIEYQENIRVEKIKDKQNPFFWIAGLLVGQEETLDINYTYDQKVVKVAIYSLECMDLNNQEEPISAFIEYQDDSFVIVKEIPGKKLDAKKVLAAVCDGVDKLAESVNLLETDCYEKPKHTSESPEVLNAQMELNKYISAEITYELGDIELILDKERISQWVSVDGLWNTYIDEECIREFTEILAETYNIPDGEEILITPTGKEVVMDGVRLGRAVGTEAEYEQLMEEIKAGTIVKRSPILAQEGTPEGETSWGDTYLEVDLTEQHMWYIKDNEVILECDVITGKPSTPTPPGVYHICEKLEDKILRGEIQPDGSYEYETPVDYWLRITWSGIGFHDATWQKEFGGQRYVEGYGSHGCINMPLDVIEELYDMVSVFDVAIIHD